jgi:hypothetical protein
MSIAAPVAPRQEIVQLEPRERAQLDAERSSLVTQIEDALPGEIAGPAEYALVADLEERLGLFIAKAEPMFDEHCNGAHKVWKSACSIRSLFLDAPKALKLRARTLLGAYKTREERERREAERRIAEEERQRQIARQKAEAKLLEKQGQTEMAAAVRAQPVSAPAVSLPSAVPVVAGLTYSTVWKWRIAGCTDVNGGRKDRDARKRAAALVPREFLDLDDAAITSRVNNMKSMAKIPGIEVYSDQVPVRR